jgi:hypothetical protein
MMKETEETVICSKRTAHVASEIHYVMPVASFILVTFDSKFTIWKKLCDWLLLYSVSFWAAAAVIKGKEGSLEVLVVT